MLMKSKSGRPIEMPSDEEDKIIKTGIAADPDTSVLTDEEWECVKPALIRGNPVGRPVSEVTKDRITIRLSHEVTEYFRATGKGWQTRIDEILQDYIETHR